MPLYDFSCRACGARFEARAAPEDTVACPTCGAAGAERVPTAFAAPRGPALRGLAAQRSDATRAAREEQRRERREQRQEQRRRDGT